MVGYNADEGSLFTNPAIIDDASFHAFVAAFFPTEEDSLIEYVESKLYPPIFDGSQPYTNNLERAILLNSEVLISCNTFYLDKAFKNRTYAYLFAVPPATHGSDLPYTFYTGAFDPSYNSPTFNETVAETLQDFIVSFAMNGKPMTNVVGVERFAPYGRNTQLMELGASSISMMTDPATNDRCKWWELGLGWHNIGRGPTWPVPDVTEVLEEAIGRDAKGIGKKINSRKEIERLKEDLRYVLEVY
jgi:carboxylesterase type B